MCQVSLNSPMKWQLASSFWENCNVNSSVPTTHSWRYQKMHCDVCAISPLPFPALFLLVTLDCHTDTHTHTHLHMNRHEGSHLRHREGTCAPKEGGEEEQCKDRKWLGGAVPREPTNGSWRVLQVIHTLTRHGLYHSGFSSSFKHLSHSLGLWLSHFVFTVPRNLALLFTASSRLLDWEWVSVCVCVLEWEDCEKVAAPSSISSPHTIPEVPGRRQEPQMLLSASACASGSRFANTAPVQTWGGQACAPRLSTALVLTTPGDTSSRFLPISTSEFKWECWLTSHQALRTHSGFHVPLSHITEKLMGEATFQIPSLATIPPPTPTPPQAY